MKREICYQNVDSEQYSSENFLRANSKFYNEGRWHSFIEPLLPDDCRKRTFLEIGCNAGMYLRLAKKKGFNRIVGTEKDKKIAVQARWYRKKIKSNYKIILQKSGAWDCDYSVLPMADVVLMSCVHYHMRPVELIELLDHLFITCQYLILVSVEDAKITTRVNRVGGQEETANNYFKHWKRLRKITIDSQGDPVPRKMYSILYESNLQRHRIDDLLNPEFYNRKLRILNYCEAFTKFVKLVIRENYDIKGTEFYKLYIQGRRPELGKERKKRIRKLMLMIRSVYLDGMKKPLLVNSHGHLLDGSHRIILLKHLGYKYVLCREVY